jgi:hypothetical protein
MSRLSEADPQPRTNVKKNGPVLRRNRRVPLHPEEVHKRLAAKSAEELPKTGWYWPFGWLLIVWKPDGTKRYVDVPASATYDDAIKVRNQELEGDCEGVTLIRKTYERPA